jgi:Lar family restriction alleviation protein
VEDCPFCGVNRVVIDTLNHHKALGTGPFRFRVQCQDCGAATRWCDTEEQAWEAWNTRRPPGKKKSANFFICKDLFFFKGATYARNPQTEFCYIGDEGGYKRIKKADYLKAYAECAKAAGKVKV